MLINRRKILASIGLLMANSVWSLLCFGQSTYTLVTSESDLVEGDTYIIVGEKNGVYKAMGNQKSNNRNAVTVNFSNNTITATCATVTTDESNAFEFILGGNTGNWTFCDKISNSYLYADGSSNNNHLKSKNTINPNAQWTIKINLTGIDTITAIGSNTNNRLRYNSSSSLFSCYSQTSTTGSLVYLFRKNTTPVEDETPPTFSSNYPKTENVTISSFDLKVKANEPCTVYYRVVAEGEPAPTVNDLLASDSTITVATGNTECSATVTGLESETTYNVYLIAKDTADNVQEDSTIISVTTVSAIQKSIALRDIEAKYYWGEMANIKWTATNFDASTDLDCILIFKGNDKILSYPIDITSGEADILIGNGITPNKDTYATNYSLKVVSGNVESERSENLTIVPLVTINQLLTDTTTRGVLNFKDKNVKIKGLVTGSKKQQNPAYKSFTLQDGDSAFCSIFVYYCVDTIVATGDSVFAEGKFNISSNEQYRIGSSTTYTSTATRINSNNNLPAPRAIEISVTQIKALMSSLIKIIGVNCDNAKSCFYIGEDTIYYKETLYTGVLNPLDNRKYDVSGLLGRGTGKRYEIWPRSEADIHLYSNDTTLANLVIGGHNVLNSDTLIINNLTITGIAATTNNAMASLSIRVNNNFVAPTDWANVTLAPLDSVFVTVTAEDGTAKTYKRIIDCKTLFFSPLASNAFGTGDTLSLSWTSYNISQISLTLDIQNNTIQLTDSAISVDLGEWNFVVPDAMFGNGLVKAVRNGVVLDSIAVTISDTKAPVVVRQSPTNGSDSLANSLYISMTFDERITVAEGAKLNIGELEFPITAVSDSAAKAFVSGLDFGTEYSVELPAGAIRDLAGNSATLPTWTFTTRTAPQPDLYFSEYAKGSSNNKYYEIYNPCDTAVNLSRYFVVMDKIVGSPRLTTLQLSGMLLPNEILVVANGSASAEIKKKTDVSNSSTTSFTGDDLLGLFRKDGNDTFLIDVLGPFGNCETSAIWSVPGDDGASGKTIVRKLIICGTTDWNESAGTDTLDSQWKVLPQNDLSSLGRHGIGHGTAILKMSIGGKAATVNSADTTVSVEVPYGTDLTKLATTYRISQGAQMLINGSVAADTIDFSSPVPATNVAGDGINQKVWTITVTMAPRPSSDKDILTFNFVETTPVSVTIDTTNATIDAVVAYNLDSLKLTPVITISEKAKVSTTLFKSSRGKFTAKNRWDFDVPQTITVTAEDTTTKVWHINVEKEPEPHLTFSPLASNTFGTGDSIHLTWTSYNISNVNLTLDIQNNTIQLTDAVIDAALGEWDFVVPDAMFGSGLVKAVRNGIVLDSITVTISDTKAPMAVRKSPASGSDNLANSLYISMVFDENVVVTEDAKLNVGSIEAAITAVNDTTVKAFVSGLEYETEYSVELPAGLICDLAGNSATLPAWTFTTHSTPQPDLYFSEYAKGSGSNKYYEIYNPCDTAVDLNRYFVTMDAFSSNGSRSQTTLQLSGWLMPDEVLIVANSSAAAEIKQKTDVSTTKTTTFTGDDLLGLFRKDGNDTVLIDVLGPFGECDVAANWVVAGDNNASSGKTIVRKLIICGTADWNESAGTDSLDSQWIVLELQNDLSSLGRHGIGHGTGILRMSIGGKAATVNNADTTVSVEVPYGTDIEHLFTTFRISQGAQMFIGEALAADTIDFSSPVLATIAAGDGINQKVWTITVTMAPRPSSDANILTFNFVETSPISVSIDTTNSTIDAVVAYNLDSLKLTPVITISEKAKVPTTLFRSSRGIFTAKTRWDFDEPQNIAVTAEDLTVKNWTVSVAREPEPHLTFSPLASNAFGTGDTISLSWTSYNISNTSLTFDIQNNTIQLTDSAISADLGGWQYTIPDAMFGNGLVKAVRNGVVLDSIAVTISDTKAPVVVRQSPANGSDSLANSLYISMTFDEKVVVTDGAKLNISELEFPITAVGDSAAKAFVSGLDFGTEYSVELPASAIRDLAGNSATLPTWTFTTRTAPQPDLYFSEYAKGSSNNKYYEIYNPYDTAVDLSRYFVTLDEFTSSSRKQTSLQLTGWLLPNEVLVVANGSASAEIKKRTDVSNSGTTKFTGDDLLGLFRKDGSDTVLIDVLGPFGNCETAANWSAAGIADASTNRTIVRKLITCGTTDWSESAGTDSLDSQWTVLPQNELSSIGRHGIGHGTEIMRMSIGSLAATVNSTDTTVSVEVPYRTDLTQLAVAYRISQGAQIFIGETLAADTIDFSQPVTATIIAGDGIHQKEWTITVTMAPRPSSDANILTFNFVETTPISVSIDTTNATIDAVVAYNLDSLNLTPVITISEKAKVPTALFRSSRGIFTAKTRWNFDEPQTIAVTAEDLTVKNWTVSVAKEPEPHLTFSPLATNSFGTGDTISLAWTSYNISQINLTLDIQNNTIQLTDSAISANLGEWSFVVPDAMFGNGLVKAVRNGVVLDSITVTISDTKAPVVVRQSPANGSGSLANSLYINIVFDERITVAEGAKLNVGSVEAAIIAVNDTMVKTFVSDLNFGTEYSVELPAGAIRDLAGNSATLPTWTFTTRTAPQPDLYFSEYAKGSSNNKYYEIYNPCDTAVDLSRYFVTMDAFSSNGSRSQATLQLSGWLMQNEVLVVANGSANAEIKKKTDISNSSTTGFTGDDLLGLFRKDGTDTVLIDVLGPFGECNVTANWSVAGVENASLNRTIVRKLITCGTTNWVESAGTDSLDSQWLVLEQQNDLSSLGRHGIGHGTEILRMSIGGLAATVSSADTSVSVEMPYGTDIEHLFTIFRISQGAQMFINGSLAADTIDFSSPVLATIAAGDGLHQKVWTITVTMAPRPSSDANILTFNFVGTTPISVSIDTTNATIDAVVAYNLDSLNLTPVITISEKAKVPTTLFRSSRGIFTAKTRWDFDEPQTIAVTAEDLTVKNWTVSVAKEPEPHLTFSPLASNSFGTGDTINLSWTSYNISDISLSLDIQNNTIQLTDSAISADLGEWDFVVPDAMFGSGLVKAVRNGIALDSIAVTISDTKAPVVVRQSPANGSDSLANSLYISINFDEQITVAEGAKLNISELEFPITTVGDSAAKAFVSGLDFGTEYSVELPAIAIRDLAGNSATLPTWTFTTRTAPQPDLYFSEYAKGSSNNKYYEIYNPCDTAVDLSRYFVTLDEFTSSSRKQTSLQLSGWLLPNEVLVVANGSASAEIKKRTDVSNSGTTKFTGDDLLGLFRKDGSDTVLIDVLGPFGNCETAANWSAAGIADASTNRTIVRKIITCGTTDWSESAGTDSLDSQWTVLPQNVLSSIGRHGIGHGTEILKMSIGGLAATVNNADSTVSVEVPYGTDIEHLFTTFRISQGAQMFIGEALAADTIDFSSPVLATIAAGDGINQKDWTITVTMAPRPSSDANILTFNFVETTPISVSIDTTNATIDAVVAYNLDSLKLTPVITIPEKAKVPTTLFKSSRGIFTAKTRWDFDEPQTIAVTAEDLTVKNWTVSVAREPEPHLTFSPLASNAFGTDDTISLSWNSYNISDISLSLDIQNNTIQLTDSAISADLGEWNFVVPDAVFGNGWVKAVRNGIAIDSIAVSIADTKAPMVVRQTPTNGSAEHINSLYISMTFDEAITIAEDAKLKVGNTEALIVAVNDTMVKTFVSDLNFGTEYSVELPAGAIRDLAGNSATLPTWTFTTRTAPRPDLYFSEYAKGSSNNKYYEIYNPCDTAVDLTRYFVTMDAFSSNGSRSQATLQLSGWLMPNEVLVVANSSAATAIKQNADVSTTKTTTFTGDDLLGLFRKDGSDTVLIDVLGPFGECDAANYWSTAGVEKVSTDHTIVRNVIICGTTYWNESAGTDSLDSQWTVLGKDDWSDLGRHGIGHNADILKMSIGGIEANIYPAATGVLVEVPYGTDLTRLAVSYRISQGAQMFINDSLAADTVDLSQPVTATVIAGDSVNQKVWTIIVTMAPKPSSDNNILTFSFVETAPISVTIDTANATIDAIMAYNLDSLKLTPVITIAEFASVSSTLFKSSKRVFTAKTKWDFNEPQTIKVTAEDLTEKVWSVRVDWEKSKELTIKDIAKLDGGLMANVGKPISTEGIVTHIVITSKGAEIHIQDSTGMWSGIMVFDEGNLYAANVAVGDRIKVSGVIAENFGMACIEQIEALAIASSDNRILTDTIIVEDALSTAYQNAIVTIDSVVCTGGFENLFAVSDSTNSILIYNKYRISDFALEIDSMYRITGIVYYTSADNSYRIIPRSADDIVKLVRPQKPEQTKPEEQKPEEQKPQEPDTTTVGIAGTHIGLTAYTIGRTIVVENAEATVTVFDIAGRLIATARPARRIAISAPHSGIYIVGTRQGTIKVRVD